MKIIDNNIEILKDNLIANIKEGSKVSIAASCFSMYAFNELAEQLKNIDELRFIFTSPSFVKVEKKNAGLVNKNVEDDIYGSTFETQFRNILTQKAIARECAEWIKSEKVSFRSIVSSEPISGFAVVQSPDKKEATAYTPLQGFTTVELGSGKQPDFPNLISELGTPFAKQYLSLFDTI